MTFARMTTSSDSLLNAGGFSRRAMLRGLAAGSMAASLGGVLRFAPPATRTSRRLVRNTRSVGAHPNRPVTLTLGASGGSPCGEGSESPPGESPMAGQTPVQSFPAVRRLTPRAAPPPD